MSQTTDIVDCAAIGKLAALRGARVARSPEEAIAYRRYDERSACEGYAESE